MQLKERFAVTPTAPRLARHSLDRLAGEVEPGLLDDVRLLVSELVTNTVRHAGIGEEGWIDMRVRTAHTLVRVEVSDAGPGFTREADPPGPDQTSGWGLCLVDRLSDRWGVQRNGLTHVWFEIDR